MIARLSASQIESFDSTTTFGCKRKWWFERIAGKIAPKDTALTVGDAVHQTLERFLKGEAQGRLHELVINAPGALEYLINLRKRIEHVELPFSDLVLAGVPITGKIDWTAANPEGRELGDHKTTSVIAKYAKTPGQLKKSIQMNIYAYRFYNLGMDISRVTQDFYQTKGAKKFEVVSVDFSKRENSARILEVEATVEEMVKASTCTKPEDLEPNLNACNIGFGCPHRNYCPRSGEFNMASLLDAFKTTIATPPPMQAVLPPDAPKSEPKKMIIVDEPIPMADFQPIPPPLPKTQGRPAGSKNKPKEFEIPNPVASPTSVTRITIRHGAKIGMPNYSSATVEVELEGTVNGSLEEAKASLSMQVQAMMVKELEIYTKKVETK